MPEALPSLADEFTPDPHLLKGLIYSDVGNVAAVIEVSDRPGYTDEEIVLPGCNKQIGVAEHSFHAVFILNGSPLGEGRSLKNINERISRDGVIGDVADQRTSNPAPNGLEMSRPASHG